MDSQRKDIADAQPDENRRTERRLARGLEDVSHLFLSQPSDRPPETAEELDALPKQVPLEPAQSKMPFLLRPSAAVNRELLISLLSGNAAVLEEGLRVIDVNIPCQPFGPIDLMALDSSDQLSILNVDTVPNNESLLRGIAHFDWIARNAPIVRRMYQGRVINFSAPPRLFLVAPGFSPLLQCVAQRSASPKVCCLEYRTVAISGGLGVLFERV